MAQIINPSLITYIYPNQVLDPTPINTNFYALVNALNTYGVVTNADNAFTVAQSVPAASTTGQAVNLGQAQSLFQAKFTAQSANAFYAGPTSGAAAVPTFRALVSADVNAITSQAPASITVGASPFAYTAPTSGNVCISGGAITQVTLARNGTTAYTSTLAVDQVVVRKGDVVTVTYTTAPTMYFLGD